MTTKPYVVVVSVLRNMAVTEYEFPSHKEAQAFRETFPNWGLFTWSTTDYDRKKKNDLK